MFEDFKSTGGIQHILGTALHFMNDFQDTVPLTSAAIQSSTFESAL